MTHYTIARDLKLPRSNRDWYEEEDAGLLVGITVELYGEKYVCTRLAVSPLRPELLPEGGVTSVSLREVRVAELIEKTARQTDIERKISAWYQAAASFPPKTRREVSIRCAAIAYKYGYAIGHHPTREVTDLLGLSRPTVNRYLAISRDRGYLGKTSERDAGIGNISSRNKALDPFPRNLEY